MTRSLDPAFITKPLAHRGLHDVSRHVFENTRSAFAAALDHGYGIELDVQLSSDGRAMVFHDETLDRLTRARGPVNRRTAAELGAITIGTGNDVIEPLDNILTQIAGQVPLLIEIKDQSLTLSQTDGVLERAVCDALSGYAGPVAIMSFNPHAMMHVQTYAPDCARGLTTCAFDPDEWPDASVDRCAALASIPDFDAVGACFISHDLTALTDAAVARIKSQGAPILCWTVRSAAQEHDARAICDNITFESYHA